MPDIQTAFEIALAKTKAHIPTAIPADWDDENPNAAVEVVETKGEAAVPKTFFSVTNNVTRETFEHVKNNPGQTRAQAVQALEKRGFSANSTTSLISQMVRQDLIREARGLLYVQSPEYRPLKTARTLKAQAQKAVVETQVEAKQPVVHIKKEKPTRAYDRHSDTPSIQINATWDAETLLNNLSIKQARALYDELRKIFGG